MLGARKWDFALRQALQMATSQFNNIISMQHRDYTLIEALGGGYQHVDNFGIEDIRTTGLTNSAKNIAQHMRQHRIKMLGFSFRYRY